jgi:peptide/nickel transport system substrate-binding protein
LPGKIACDTLQIAVIPNTRDDPVTQAGLTVFTSGDWAGGRTDSKTAHRRSARREDRVDDRYRRPKRAGSPLAWLIGGRWVTVGAALFIFGVIATALAGAFMPRAAVAQDTPKPGGTLTAAIGADPVNLDPHLSSAYSTFQVLENVYNQLVGLDADLQVIPELAESWTVSDDKLTYTFTMRQGVMFHNGRELTADDVVYSYERIRNPETNSGWAYLFDPIDTIAAPDPQTVTITTKEIYAPLLTKLASQGTAIVPREEVEAGTLDQKPVGTGPFTFVEFVPADHLTIQRNENYWEEGLPYLDEVIFKPIPDETVKQTNLDTQNVDWADGVPAKDADALMESSDLVVQSVAGTSYTYIGVNTTREPLNDKRVRQAISYALDREEIAAIALYDLAVPSQSPVPEGNFWRSEYAPYERDLDKAKALLEEAGVGDGFTTEFMPAKDYAETVRSAEAAQAQLADIGIEATLRPLEWSTWLDEEGQGNFDMYICGWIGMVDPDDYFYAQHHTDQVFNFTGYSNPDLDALLDQGRQELDQDARKQIYEQIQQILLDDLPYIFLFTTANVNAWQPYVNGYAVRPDSAIVFKGVWLDK